MDNLQLSWFFDKTKASFNAVKSFKYTPHILVPSIGICVFVTFKKPSFTRILLKAALKVPQVVIYTALCYVIPPLKKPIRVKYFDAEVIFTPSFTCSYHYLTQYLWTRFKRAWNEIEVGETLSDKDMVYFTNGYVSPLSRVVIPRVRLQKNARTDKYVCLLFGSCSSPAFMASLKRLYELHCKYHTTCNLIVVYTREAHADDGWKLEGNVVIKQHQTIDDKIRASKQLIGLWTGNVTGMKEAIDQAKIQIVVDDIEGDLERKFNAYPERLFILDKEGKVVLKGGVGPYEYNVNVIDEFLGRLNTE